MAILQSTVLRIVLFLSGLCGHGAQAQFVVFRGDEVSQLQNLTEVEKLEVAARSGETHFVELTELTQGGAVQGNVSLNIDCLPWLEQNSEGSEARWFFLQLDECGNVRDPTALPEEEPPNENNMPQPRIVVGGERNRWLNITRTVSIQGPRDPDSKIFMCKVCETADCSDGNISSYTQLIVGSPPVVQITSDEICISARDSEVVPLQCEILNHPQPNPTRSWFKNDELIYSVLSGASVSPTDYYMKYPILSPGVLEPPVISATSDGTIYFNHEVKNITNPDELSLNTTVEQARRMVLEHLVGNWTCKVSNTFGPAISITYIIIDQCTPRFAISPRSITVSEDTPHVEICIHVETKLFRNVEVTAQIGQNIGAGHQATGSIIMLRLFHRHEMTMVLFLTPLHANSDYRATAATESLNFVPSDQIKCINIQIVDDDITNEPDEEFSVTLTSATPFGDFSNTTAVITIIDNDPEIEDGPDASSIDANAITIAGVTVAAALVLLLLLAVSMCVFYIMMRTDTEIRAKADFS